MVTEVIVGDIDECVDTLREIRDSLMPEAARHRKIDRLLALLNSIRMKLESESTEATHEAP